MIVVRFKIQCQPGKAKPLISALKEVVSASRKLDGVISFDVGQDLVDENAFVTTEVFEDRAALDLQEELPEVKKTIGLLGDVAAGKPEATIFHISRSEPWG